MNTFVIFDKSGFQTERFTVINRETGDVFGASDNPDASNRKARYIGNCADHRVVLRGAEWRQGLPTKKMIKTETENYVNNARLDPKWIGKEIDYEALPENIRSCIDALNVPGMVGSLSDASVVYMSTGKDHKAPASGR